MLSKVKKAKSKRKAKRARKARATQEIKQIVNIKGLAGLGSKPQQPFIFQAQREGPVSSSQDFFTSALKQINRVNQPSENIQEVKDNMRKLERELSRQNLTNKQILLEADLLKTKYQTIQRRSDGVGDFSQPNKPRNLAKEQERFQDRSILTPRRGNRGPMSAESKAKGRETRARNKALRERMETPTTPAPMMMSALESEQVFEQDPEQDPDPEQEQSSTTKKGREAFI